MISRKDIQFAHDRISSYIRKTPMILANDERLGPMGSTWLKLEQLQHTGSFKPRGVFNSLLGTELPSGGVAAVSGGNHGSAIGYAAKRLGIESRVFVPKFAGQVKIDLMRSFGATVEVKETVAEAFSSASEYCERSKALFIHPWDQIGTVEGQGTIGLEMEQQVPALDTILVAVGGAGLIGGIAAWYEGSVRIVSVESEGTATLANALLHGRASRITASGITASALGAPEVGKIGFELAQRHVNASVVVSDDDIVEAARRLWAAMRSNAEPGGVTALAALTSGKYVPAAGERIGVLICGGNADPGWFMH